MSLSDRLAYSFFYRYRINGQHDRIGPIYFSGEGTGSGHTWAYHGQVIVAEVTQGQAKIFYCADNGHRTKPVFARLAAVLARCDKGRLIRPTPRAKNWTLALKNGQLEPWVGKKVFWSGNSPAEEQLPPIAEYLRELFRRYDPEATFESQSPARAADFLAALRTESAFVLNPTLPDNEEEEDDA